MIALLLGVALGYLLNPALFLLSGCVGAGLLFAGLSGWCGMALLLGIDVDRTISLTFVVGAALAAVAGVMVTLYYGVIDFFMGFIAGLKAFTAAVLGGIGSLPGAMLGGMLLGMVEAFWSGYFSVEYKDVAAFGILVLVLIFRPTGLLGCPEIEKV